RSLPRSRRRMRSATACWRRHEDTAALAPQVPGWTWRRRRGEPVRAASQREWPAGGDAQAAHPVFHAAWHGLEQVAADRFGNELHAGTDPGAAAATQGEAQRDRR